MKFLYFRRIFFSAKQDNFLGVNSRQCHRLTLLFFISDLTNIQSCTIVRRAGLSSK